MVEEVMGVVDNYWTDKSYLFTHLVEVLCIVVEFMERTFYQTVVQDPDTLEFEAIDWPFKDEDLMEMIDELPEVTKHMKECQDMRRTLGDWMDDASSECHPVST